ncbi:MAG: AMP-binding protein [Thermomicrobiales bacterium]
MTRLPDALQTIPEALAYWASQTPDAPALIVPGGRAVAYATLWDNSRALGDVIRGAGIRSQDRVVLLLPDGPALVAALLGTMSAATAVPLSSALTARELDAALDGLRATAALVTPAVSPALRECCAQRGVAVLELNADIASQNLTIADEVVRRAGPATWPRSQDIAVVRQTSGTTGKPKRVPRTHGELIAFGTRHRDQFHLRQGDRAPSVAPLTLTLGQTVLLHGIVAGGALICPPMPDITLARLWEAIEAERPTWMSVSAGFLELLARALRGRPDRPEASALRFVEVTSAPISPETCDVLDRQLGAPILPRYSSSEAGGVAITLPPPAPHRPGSVGRPMQEVRIVDADGNDVAPGGEGEIWVRGPNVFAGYLDDPTANATAFAPGGWFRTGDVGVLDEDGFLFLTGRIHELINRGGSKIAPCEVDAVLLAHRAVRAAATFPVRDARLGEDIVAAVVLESGSAILPRALRRWMLDRLQPDKVPRRIWFVDALPLTPTGKVQRGELTRIWLENQR